MMKKYLYLLSAFLLLFGCQNQEIPVDKELWMEKPVSEWPDIALTNTVHFSDTTYSNIANSFLVNTGHDTLAVTCKHIFMLFKNNDLNTIDLGNDFISWNMHPKGQDDKIIEIESLINTNSREEIGEFNTLKVRDWIIFNFKDEDDDIYPLKLRTTPVKKGEIVYSVGWAYRQTSKMPSLVKMQVYQNLGPYYYFQTLTENVDPAGRSGSPVIDKNGYLVGIVSGQEHNLGIIGSVAYLKELLDKYGIEYDK